MLYVKISIPPHTPTDTHIHTFFLSFFKKERNLCLILLILTTFSHYIRKSILIFWRSRCPAKGSPIQIPHRSFLFFQLVHSLIESFMHACVNLPRKTLLNSHTPSPKFVTEKTIKKNITIYPTRH